MEHDEDNEKPMHGEPNTVYIGKRPAMNYVMATMIILTKGENCTIKARGQSFSHAGRCCQNFNEKILSKCKIPRHPVEHRTIYQ